MKRNNSYDQYTTSFRIRNTDNRPKIPDQEKHTHGQTHPHKDPIEQVNRTPTNQGHRNPNHIRIAIHRQTLSQTRTLTYPKPS